MHVVLNHSSKPFAFQDISRKNLIAIVPLVKLARLYFLCFAVALKCAFAVVLVSGYIPYKFTLNLTSMWQRWMLSALFHLYHITDVDRFCEIFVCVFADVSVDCKRYGLMVDTFTQDIATARHCHTQQRR
jgi:hypothetical protein